jgi:protein-S-isoprenylcysteine O-methyltransferase Ste14
MALLNGINVNSAIGYTWEALGLVWLAGLAFTKRTVRRQPAGARLFHLALALTGFTMLGSRWFQYGWFATRFVPSSRGLELTGLAITLGGCLFAIWARLILGSNWSGQATVKAGHELVVTGPYALTRHPIYTGLITGAVGTAFGIGEMRCISGIAIVVLALMIKMSQEERLMMQAFPDAYPAYRQRVKALIPGVL